MASKPKQPEPVGSNYPVITDKKLVAIVEKYATKKAEQKLIEARLAELKSVIVDALGDAPVAYVGKRIVSVTEKAGTPSTDNVVITKGMVGQIIPGKPGRAGSTELKVW